MKLEFSGLLHAGLIKATECVKQPEESGQIKVVSMFESTTEVTRNTNK